MKFIDIPSPLQIRLYVNTVIVPRGFHAAEQSVHWTLGILPRQSLVVDGSSRSAAHRVEIHIRLGASNASVDTPLHNKTTIHFPTKFGL